MENDLNKINHKNQNMEAYKSRGGKEVSEKKICKESTNKWQNS